MKKISILGCGWLGLPLAKAILKKGVKVNGSTTSSDKLAVLEKAGINPFLITLAPTPLNNSNNETAIELFLQGSEILIVAIPPKLRGHLQPSIESVFVKKIASLLPFLEKSTIKNVLFISSTSVYGESQAVITELTKPQPDSESGKQLIECELLLQHNPSFKTTILRFGGLIGLDRQPAKYLAGKDNLGNPDAPVNLIDLEDAMGIILKIIETNSWGETFNAVAPFHPSRENYYTQKAAELNLALPKFTRLHPSIGKTISSQKVQKKLNYIFLKPNL